VYEKCGFEVVGNFVVGKGSFSAIGEKEAGGSGVPVWAMLWKPESEKGENGGDT
jgi:hypothetical protein